MSRKISRTPLHAELHVESCCCEGTCLTNVLQGRLAAHLQLMAVAGCLRFCLQSIKHVI
jgi:hypothetical protein